MQTKLQRILPALLLAAFLPACASLGTPTPTETPTVVPSPSPTPFGRYGQTLTDVTYCTMGGAPQTMDVYLPASGGPWPVLVYVHGGSWMKGDKAEAAGLGAGMTPQGYVVASLDYRMYPAVKFPGMIEDLKCAIRSLRAHAAEYNLDPQRIAVMGASSGGHLAALLGTSDESAGWDVGEYIDQSSRVQAVIAMAVPADLTRKFSNANIQTLILVAFGRKQIEAGSPVTHVTPDDPPFLIFHGDRDAVIPFEQGQILYDKLTEAGVPAQLVIVRNGDHSLTAVDGSATPTLDEINQMILDFLEKYLK